jgi:hypothetical protein
LKGANDEALCREGPHLLSVEGKSPWVGFLLIFYIPRFLILKRHYFTTFGDGTVGDMTLRDRILGNFPKIIQAKITFFDSAGANLFVKAS